MTQRIPDVNGWYEIKNNPLSKVGVFPYLGRNIGAPDPDKLYSVLRPADELANPDTVNSFRLLPLIDDHTMLGDENSGFTPAEQKGVQGTTGDNVSFNNATGILQSNIKVFSERLKKLIESGKKQLSCGYRCLYEAATGTYQGQTYDYIQRNIRGNHLALVDQGRMGPDVRVLDCQDHFIITNDSMEFEHMTTQTGEKKAPTLDSLAAAMDEISKVLSKIVAKDEEEMKAAETKKADEEKAEADKKAADEAAAVEAAKTEKEKLEGDKKGMDAMEKKLTAVQDELDTVKKNGIKTLLAEVSQRDQLAQRLAPFIGSFDHAEKTLSEVAEYGAEKLGLKCEKGQEKTALDGYLHGRDAPTAFVSVDSKDKKVESGMTAYLNGQK